MANHKSAIKRTRQNEVRRMRNKTVRTRVKNVVKSVRMAAGEKGREEAAAELNAAKSVIAKAAKKGVLHPWYREKQQPQAKIPALYHHRNSCKAPQFLWTNTYIRQFQPIV